jgi:D-hydroxyproline dehydrogenase subunit alpha
MSKQVVVVGAGIAGCSAALEAAQQGLQVMLVDEHPQSLSMMSLDTPYFYGARLAPVLSDSSAIAERVLGANEPLMLCLEAGVDVVTNTSVWGSFTPSANSTHAKRPQLGLADAEKSWMVEYDHLILAPGARDLVLSFPGWQLPGVMGAAAALALMNRYRALFGERLVILGSGNLGLTVAKRALASGLQIAAIVDVAPAVRGDAGIAEELRAAGVNFLLSQTIQDAQGSDSVQSVRLRALDDQMQPKGLGTTEIDCDTVCMAFGLVPNIELPAVTGCELEFRGDRGGWIPKLDSQMRSSLPTVSVVGDGAGVTETTVLDSQIAVEQARVAARAIARASATAPQLPPQLQSTVEDSVAQQWLRTMVAVGGMDTLVCQCEEVTRRELLAVQPPRYLAYAAKMRAQAASPTAQTSQDFFKRMTRVGMGHCQGKRCREQSAMLLANAAHRPVGDIAPGSYRVPVRPIPLNVIACYDETEEMRKTWPVWFQPLNEGEVG